jgi:hypothetical protein
MPALPARRWQVCLRRAAEIVIFDLCKPKFSVAQLAAFIQGDVREARSFNQLHAGLSQAHGYVGKLICSATNVCTS